MAGSVLMQAVRSSLLKTLPAAIVHVERPV
jgi:hypothetical protein